MLDVDLGKKVICTCRTGMTASVLYTALRILGKEDVALYDGSWLEWTKFPENECKYLFFALLTRNKAVRRVETGNQPEEASKTTKDDQ